MTPEGRLAIAILVQALHDAHSTSDAARRSLARHWLASGDADVRFWRSIAEVPMTNSMPRASQWITVEVPALRVIDPAQASAVDARLEWLEGRMLETRQGARPSGCQRGKPAGSNSPYPADGVASVLGLRGTVEAGSTTSGGSGPTDARLRDGGASRLLESAPRGYDRPRPRDLAHGRRGADGSSVHRADGPQACLTLADDDSDRDRDRTRLRADLDKETKAAERLASPIAAGGPMDVLLRALKETEARRDAARAQLAALRECELDVTELWQALKRYVADWERMLAESTEHAQHVLRKLIVGRLALAPDGSFAGIGTVEPVIANNPKLASPTGPFLSPSDQLESSPAGHVQLYGDGRMRIAGYTRSAA